VLKKHWPEVPCYHDVRELTADVLRRDGIAVDVICGGFPCQDISSAGSKAGIKGQRSGLWAHYARLVREIRPKFIIVENVAALLARGMGTVLGDLAEIRYDAQWQGIPASFLGAPHGRDRIWIIAYPNNEGEPVSSVHDEARRLPADGDAVHPERAWTEVSVHLARAWWQQERLSWDRVWPDEDSPMGVGVDDGLPERLDRLKSLGNAVVPQIPELIGNAILESMRAAA
jgi:DNA (cytosine-5)-methyltransferase 1